MNLTEYQYAVLRTRATTDRLDTLKLAVMGLCDELGELAGPLKKYLWHGHGLDTAHLSEEVGDVLWYLATLCNALGLSLQEALTQNIAKLQRRYPHGFSTEASRTREQVEASQQPQAQTEALLAQLKLCVWQASTDALVLSLDNTPISEADRTYLGEQVGSLLTFLARLSIVPLDPPAAESAFPERSLES